MRRVYTLLILCSLAIESMAQTQQGYVKTLGRPNQKGVALSGVTVRVKGAHNAVLSKNDGTFSIMINGDSYSLQQVQKSGYELNEMGVIGRKYAYSAQVPLTVVMVSTAQLQADKQRIENKAYQVAEMNYKAKMEVLEKQKADNAITSEQYRQQIQELQDKFEKYQSLIDGLADHYAHVDYDELDEKEREINLCIENGDLERADQLLQQIGIQQRIADIESRLATGQSLMDEAYKDMAAVLKQQEKDAEYLYQLYTIALSRFDNEKARTYIETRAALDTTNVEWQNEAGEYIHEYLADFPKALSYFVLSLRQSMIQFGDKSEWVARSYINIGGVHLDTGELTLAKEEFSKALQLYIDLFGHTHPDVAISYNNIGLVYSKLEDYANAMVNYQNSLDIRLTLYGKKHPDIAKNYNNIAMTYKDMGDYSKAEEYLMMSVDIRKCYEEQSLDMASSYINLGSANVRKGDINQAFDYFQKALDIIVKILGEKHPKVAVVTNNMGYLYSQMKKNEEALKCYYKVLEIRKELYGDNHPDVASTYSNIAVVLNHQENYEESIKLQTKSLNIRKSAFGANHPKVAESYNNLGSVYLKLNKAKEAIDCFDQAIIIEKKLLGDEHPSLAVSYANLGRAYHIQGDFQKALDYNTIALDTFLKKYGENHLRVANCQAFIGDILFDMKKYEDALDYYNKAAHIYNTKYGSDHPTAILINKNIEDVKEMIKKNKVIDEK